MASPVLSGVTRPRRRPWLACVAALLALPGCGSDAARSVRGKVTQDSRPMANAEVVFTSQGAGEAKSFFAVATSDGNYQLDLTGVDSLPSGDYEVTVTWWTLNNGQPLPAGEEGSVLKEDGQARKHTATLQKQVGTGDVTIDLDVAAASKAKPPSR